MDDSNPKPKRRNKAQNAIIMQRIDEMIDEMHEPKAIAHLLGVGQKTVYSRIWDRNLRRAFVSSKERSQLIVQRKEAQP